MCSAFSLSSRHTLHAVNAHFGAEDIISMGTVDFEDRFLEWGVAVGGVCAFGVFVL
jgi:hypothetical protein